MVAAGASDYYNNDVIIMANAFRAARDEDTRTVLNVMAAKKTSSSLNDLTFYMVPSVWMLKAWPMLSAVQSTMSTSGHDDDKWRERVGIIQNAELVAWDHTVSSSDEEGGDNDHKSKRQQPSPDSSNKLRSGLRHGEDYFLLGPNVWLLVKNKFGDDNIELARPVVFHNAEESTLAVAIDPPHPSNGNADGKKQLIPIPPAGYFNYSQLIQDLEGDSQESFLAQPAHAPQQQPLQQAPELKQTDVVSDEDGEPNDLFPDPSSDEPDDMVMSGESSSRIQVEPSQEGGVLLLPASTTQVDNNNTAGGSLYPTVQDMECSENPAMEETKEDPTENVNGITTAAVVPVVATPSFKRHGSGLGNLGNTCFMNSTLQCLAHTDPLRRYFLSGEFKENLNRENPLGTGGDLAEQFADLLAEMWGTTLPSDRRRVFPKVDTTSTYVSANTSSVVYPRNFKFTLGKHAEQFMGYDQHDSQELATYLLDALHEDTNRVTKKPYVEKPEKGEDEPDELAAKKAWDLHLKREDSRVLEMFMGQIKSRVQCCKSGCGRVSTTFDPFMYLSVPIPGSSNRTMRITFVPLDPQERRRNVSVTLSKAATVGKLVAKTVEQLMKAGFPSNGEPIPLDELVACDVWNHDVYSFYTMEDEIDKIRDTDETYIYQVQPKSEIQKMEKDNDPGNDGASEDEAIAEALESVYRPTRYTLDAKHSIGLGRGDEWKENLENYLVMSNMQVMKILNPRRGTNTERYDLYQKMDDFVQSCIQEADKASNKRAREELDGDTSLSSQPDQTISADSECIVVSAEEDDVPALVKLSDESPTFTKVKTRFDVGVLESCAKKLRRMILESVKSVRKNKDNKDGTFITVTCRRNSSALGGTTYSSTQEKPFVNPIVLRIPATMTVYGLREELSKQFVRSLRLQQPPMQDGNPSGESDVIPMEGDSDLGDHENLSGVEAMTVSSDSHIAGGDPALQILRQVPFAYRKKSSGYGQSKLTKQLGSLDSDSPYNGTPPISLASPTDEDEKQLVAEWVGHCGSVYLDWPSQLCERYFDEAEFDMTEDVKDPAEEEAIANRTRNANRVTTILDCVEAFCQMEQLEETEMWYCNRCKEHVRAWKQFHLFRAPPILIMHLKRFQYSASSHRRDKISTFIDFPLTGLDLSEHVNHGVNGEKPVYDCYAVSNHYGGLGGGHYTAYALNDDGVWCHYDDSRITEDIDPKEVVSEAAYVVYYRRKDVVINGDFLESLETPTPAVVTDHLENRTEGALSETSSTHAAQGDDMDVEFDNALSDHSRTDSSSPMDSHDGGDNNYADPDIYGEGESSYYNHARGTIGNDFPLQ